jgi:hypothetical protein
MHLQGEQKSLDDYHNDLQDEMDDGAVFDEESLGKVEYERLMDQLEEKRQTETRGARATNKAAANDARKTSMSIGEQLTNLYERTGVRAFTVFSRGNADDDTLPQAVDSDNALEFFLQEMGTDQLDVMRKFERYSCTMDEGEFFSLVRMARTLGLTEVFSHAQEERREERVRRHVEAPHQRAP